MKQISFYKTIDNSLEKTSCSLIEKCYYNNLKSIVIVPNLEMQESLNKLLWTYSKKHFIPHGSSSDILPSLQPVYITEKFENPNDATVVILINKEELDQGVLKSDQIKRIIAIYDNEYEAGFKNLYKGLKANYHNECNIDFFSQQPNGNWSKIEPN